MGSEMCIRDSPSTTGGGNVAQKPHGGQLEVVVGVQVGQEQHRVLPDAVGGVHVGQEHHGYLSITVVCGQELHGNLPVVLGK